MAGIEFLIPIETRCCGNDKSRAVDESTAEMATALSDRYNVRELAYSGRLWATIKDTPVQSGQPCSNEIIIILNSIIN